MFHIVTLLLFSSIMFAAVYQFWFNKNDMMMTMMVTKCREQNVVDKMSWIQCCGQNAADNFNTIPIET